MKILLRIALIFLIIGCSSGSDSSETLKSLLAPANVRATSITANSITFVWNKVDDAKNYSYVLKQGESTVSQSTIAGTEIKIDNLNASTTYTFSVKANANIGFIDSEYSAAISAATTNNAQAFDFEFPTHENDNLVRAFPGAEGGGMFTTGGRGGKVYHVTTLEDNASEGSLRHAINQSGARTIVFDVDGIIELKSTLKIQNGNVTIAGQTSPGDGICLKNYALQISCDNVIVRYIRCRMGDEANNEDDAMWGRYQKNIIIDHCSMSWSTDECASFYANRNFTMQWCILAESLRNSKHNKGTHGYGGIWGGANVSYHHNLLAHHDSRNPRFDSGDVYGTANNTITNAERSVDFRNCVVYNFSNYPAYGGDGQKINFVGNTYKWGPASQNGSGNSCDSNGQPTVSQKAKQRKYFYSISGINNGVDFGCPEIYIGGNSNVLNPNNNGVNEDNWNGFVYNQSSQGATTFAKLSAPVAIAYDSQACKVTTHTADIAFEKIMNYGGASFKRDAVDTRVIGDTRNGTATIMNGSNGSKNGYIDSQTDAGGYPTYSAGTAKTDSDGDGIPDEWEDQFGLNKNNAADGNSKTLDPTARYTNLEVYLHWIVRDITKNQTGGGTYQ